MLDALKGVNSNAGVGYNALAAAVSGSSNAAVGAGSINTLLGSAAGQASGDATAYAHRRDGGVQRRPPARSRSAGERW